MSKYTEEELQKELETKEYEYGFYTDIESDTFPIGLNEDIVRAISLKKNEPQWMTDWRLEAFRIWSEMEEPDWANVHYEKPDFQAISYYSAPKKADPNKTLDDVDPELLEMYRKLGISVDEQKKLQGVAIDIVVDSVSVATTSAAHHAAGSTTPLTEPWIKSSSQTGLGYRGHRWAALSLCVVRSSRMRTGRRSPVSRSTGAKLASTKYFDPWPHNQTQLSHPEKFLARKDTRRYCVSASNSARFLSIAGLFPIATQGSGHTLAALDAMVVTVEGPDAFRFLRLFESFSSFSHSFHLPQP